MCCPPSHSLRATISFSHPCARLSLCPLHLHTSGSASSILGPVLMLIAGLPTVRASGNSASSPPGSGLFCVTLHSLRAFIEIHSCAAPLLAVRQHADLSIQELTVVSPLPPSALLSLISEEIPPSSRKFLWVLQDSICSGKEFWFWNQIPMCITTAPAT